MKKTFIRISVLLLILIVFILLFLNIGVYRLLNPSYLMFVLSDEPFGKEMLLNQVLKDPYRDQLVKGKNLKQIKTRFGDLIVDKSQNQDGFVLFIEESVRSRDELKNKKVNFLWLTNEQPVLIIMVDDKGYELNLFKG